MHHALIVRDYLTLSEPHPRSYVLNKKLLQDYMYSTVTAWFYLYTAVAAIIGILVTMDFDQLSDHLLPESSIVWYCLAYKVKSKDEERGEEEG